MEYNHKALGFRISKYREVRKLTQKQLSNLTGISKSYIADLETGVGNSVSLAKLIRIAEALNVSVDNLLCDSLIKLSKNKDIKQSKIKLKILDEISIFSDEQIIKFNLFISEFIKYKKI